LKTAVVVDTKLQTHVTPEMFGEGYEIAVAAMNGISLLSQIFYKHFFFFLAKLTPRLQGSHSTP
jgi:hypothetical protein